MKYFLIFLISFALFLPVYAAKTVKGTVPVLQPLQPPAAGVYPDVQNNFQSRGPDSQPAGQAASSGNSAQNSQPSSVGESQTPNSAGYLPSQTSKPRLWILLLVVLAGLLGFFWVWKGSKKDEPR
jgi:hypothetical protein